MTKISSDFLGLLFNPGETICVSPNKFGYHSVPLTSIDQGIHLISPREDKAPITIAEKDINLVAINPINGFRRDANVTSFRSFLVEVDT